MSKNNYKNWTRIYIIEIYYRGDKENEDRERIKKYYGKS